VDPSVTGSAESRSNAGEESERRAETTTGVNRRARPRNRKTDRDQPNDQVRIQQGYLAAQEPACQRSAQTGLTLAATRAG
jgi:hypothetical protein